MHVLFFLASDFATSSSAFTVSPGASNGDMVCLNISIIDDDRVEYDETFSITLTVDNPLDTINGGSTAIAEVTILDNDGTYVKLNPFIKLYSSFYTGLIYSVPPLELSEDFSSFPLCVAVDVQGGLERPAGVTFTGPGGTPMGKNDSRSDGDLHDFLYKRVFTLHPTNVCIFVR